MKQLVGYPNVSQTGIFYSDATITNILKHHETVRVVGYAKYVSQTGILYSDATITKSKSEFLSIMYHGHLYCFCLYILLMSCKKE